MANSKKQEDVFLILFIQLLHNLEKIRATRLSISSSLDKR